MRRFNKMLEDVLIRQLMSNIRHHIMRFCNGLMATTQIIQIKIILTIMLYKTMQQIKPNSSFKNG
jgi:hypothetical protein